MNPFKLLFLRFIFGKFSYTYQNSVHSYGKLPNSRKKYLKSCSRNDPLSHYRKVAEGKNEISVFQSDNELQFGKVQFGISFSKLCRQKSDFKCYDVEKYADVIWKRIGYKERLFNYGVKRVYHFLDEKFFFGELLFSDIRQVDHKKIGSALIKKYANMDHECENSDFRINFRNGYVYFENSGIHLSIKYISTAFQEVNEKLGNILQEIKKVGGSTKSEPFEVL